MITKIAVKQNSAVKNIAAANKYPVLYHMLDKQIMPILKPIFGPTAVSMAPPHSFSFQSLLVTDRFLLQLL